MATEDVRLDGQGDLRAEPEGLLEQEHPGGGLFNRLILITFAAVAIVSGVVVALGVESSGIGQSGGVQKAGEDPGASARNNGEIADLAAHGGKRLAAPTFIPPPVVVATVQAPIQNAPPQPPSRYAQWAEEKYMKALESPQMVSAFHDGGTLEISRGNSQHGTNFNVGDSTDPTVTLHPPASAFSVMAGSVIPAVLVSGINSDLPGPILAQVSQNVFDSATGKYLLVPQGSRLIGIYQNASIYGQQRVEIAWQRLIFPNTSSMNLPQMPGADQGGYAGFTDEVNNRYMRTFGTAALMSLISAGQMVGQMATFGGGGTYGPYGYSQPNQWAMASQTAGSAASGQFGAVGQQMIGPGDESSTDYRNPTRLPVQRDGHRGPRVPGGLQRLNVHKSYTERMRDCARNVHKTDSRRRAMGVLKRKEEPTETITLRVPASVKAEIDRLRERTSEAGFDLNATICESIIRLTRQMRDEMDGLDGKTGGRDRSRKPAKANGPAHSDRMFSGGAADGEGGA